MSNDTITLRARVNTGFAECHHEDEQVIDRADWEAMTKKEQDQHLDQFASGLLQNSIDCNAWVVEDEEEG